LYVDVVVNVRVISRLVEVKPPGPVQRQVPPEVGCGPNCTELPEETVALETFCQAPPLTRRYGFTGVAAQPPEEDELELLEDEELDEELEELLELDELLLDDEDPVVLSIRIEESMSLKPLFTRQVVSPALMVTDVPVWLSPSKRMARYPAATRIEEASLFGTPAPARALVLKLPVALKLAAQPPKLQCW
jgi:hypothetical protein